MGKVLELAQGLNPELFNFKLGQCLGKGADGEVYDLGSKVIKFSIMYDHYYDNSIFDQASKQIEYLNFIISSSPKHIVNVYSAELLGSSKRQTTQGFQGYVITFHTMEKLEAISEDEKKVFHTILSHEDNNVIKDYRGNKLSDVLKNLEKGLDFSKDKVIELCEDIQDSPIRHNDIHVRNIMKNKLGNFKLIDLDRLEILDEN
jgi:hypothetical protein